MNPSGCEIFTSTEVMSPPRTTICCSRSSEGGEKVRERVSFTTTSICESLRLMKRMRATDQRSMWRRKSEPANRERAPGSAREIQPETEKRSRSGSGVERFCMML